MKIKKVGWIVVSVLLVSTVILYASMRLEITESYYETYEKVAEVPNVFDAGWIPAWLPKTAKQIKESHDIDTNEVWITFEYSASDKFYEACLSVEKKTINLPSDQQENRFPSFVAESLSKIKNKALDFYQCDKGGNRYLAIDAQSMQGYIWRIP